MYMEKEERSCVYSKTVRTARVSMSSYLKSKCHIYALVYDFFFSLSDLLHSV